VRLIRRVHRLPKGVRVNTRRLPRRRLRHGDQEVAPVTITVMSVIRGRMRLETIRGDATVTPLELFFDLVFVFALTQVTAFMAAELSWQGLLQGLLIFGLLWWSWVAYAWLGNVVKADEGACRLVMFGAMAAMFVIALSIPESFDDLPTGLHAPVVIAVCYFLFRSIHLAMYWIAARGDGGLRAQLGRFSASMFTATTLLLLAAGADGKTQTALWGAALLADYGGTYVGGASGWRIGSAASAAGWTVSTVQRWRRKCRATLRFWRTGASARPSRGIRSS